MKTIGYIQAVKSNGAIYFYVRQSYRDKEDRSKVLKRTILKLGQQPKAVERLQYWINNENEKPSELSGFSAEDFKSWLEYIRDKVS